MESFEFQRRPIAQSRMASMGVIPTFDEIEHCLPRRGMRGQGHAVEQFAFQRRKETLGHRVIKTIACRGQRLRHAPVAVAGAEGQQRVLGSLGPNDE